MMEPEEEIKGTLDLQPMDQKSVENVRELLDVENSSTGLVSKVKN